MTDRDSRARDFAVSRAASGQRRRGRAPAPQGGALCRVIVGTLAPAREDDRFVGDVPGMTVPVGYARYISPVVDPARFAYVRLGAWRVAVPRRLCAPGRAALLKKLYVHGPGPAGYVRWGDTLVPASLEPGDRATIGEAAP